MANPILSALTGRAQFIVYRLELKPGGKFDKIPFNVATGENLNAQDQSAWMTPEAAAGAAQLLGPGFGVGLVLTPGLFCIDLDSALVDGQWSELAVRLCTRFAGAAIEVSVSGKGLHIFGCYTGPEPQHKTRAPGMELYTSGRFIALGASSTGEIRTDCTELLYLTLGEFFPESSIALQGEWTDGPYAGWRGGGSDEQIIQMLMQQRSAVASFGDGAAFRALWRGDYDELARSFPTSTMGEAYDASAADMALVNHLLYGTGFDCERTLRLIRSAAIYRSKWDREDYLRRTIIKAVAGRIPETAKLPSAPPPADNQTQSLISTAGGAALVPPPPPSPADFAPGAYISAGQQLQLFAGCWYIADMHGALLPDGSIVAAPTFDVHYGGHDFQMRVDGAKPVTSAWTAFTENQVINHPKAQGLCFDPRQPAGAQVRQDGQVFINSWQPIEIPKMRGDPAPFLNHLKLLYPNGEDAEILLAYFAFIVQYPGVKAQWWPLLQGVEGNGKTFFSHVMEHCVGKRYTHHAKASQIDSRFNLALYGKLLVCVEDVYISEARGTMWETLKPMITNTRMEIEGKGVEKVTRDICFNGIMNSNHRDAIRKTPNDRRLGPFFGAQQRVEDLTRDGLTPGYFKALYGWAQGAGYAIVADYLSRYRIPDALNPAVDCVRAPLTTSTRAAVQAGQSVLEQELDEAITSGRLGFRGGWVASTALDGLLRDLGRARYMPRTKRAELLEAFGYELHPGLPEGRLVLPLSDGTRPQLYITKDHPSRALTTPEAIENAYVLAQARGR